MKLPLSWLKDYLDTQASLEDISKKLTAIGLEVEGVTDPARALDGFVVGHVVSAERHPDADKLQCLVVDTGTAQLKVVCGAPNARAGLKGVFAPAGSYIPGLGVTLKKALIRGQESNGMMCSEKELEISDAHGGIIELAPETQVGAAAAPALGLDDPVLDINLTPNRGDCAGVYGVARDAAAAGLGTLKPLQTGANAGTFPSPVAIEIKDEKACPLFIGHYIKGVKNGASPAWLQARLKAAGLRPISALVDITNYFCLGLNRPLHVFDADKLSGNISVRLSQKGETLDALNDLSYTLDDGMTVVCDDAGVLALGGIMGGTRSAVSDDTVNVFLETACFDAVRTAKTGQRLQIDSDARYRFERGIDPAFASTGADMAVRMILDICGGEASAPVVAGQAPVSPRVMSYAPDRLASLGGLPMDASAQKSILSKLGFAVDDAEKTWRVTVPSWRHDVAGAADIVEEILRINGYDAIPPVLVRPENNTRAQTLSPLAKRASLARRLLAARGMHETVTWSFLDDKTADLFGANDRQNKKALTLSNPISADLAVMRPSILPNLLTAAGRNADRGIANACLFEIGNCYHSPEADGQLMTVAGLRTGQAVQRHWAQGARDVDAYDAKQDALAVLESCGVKTENLQITTDVPAWYHPGRAGALRQGAVVLAYFGELHPSVLAAMKRDEKCAGFEIFLQAVPQPRNKSARKELLKPSPFQPLGRDFAFVLDASVPAEKILRAIKSADKTLISAIEVFDVYTGKGVPEGKKSVAVGVTLQPVEKTLTDEEIAAVCTNIVAAVEKQTGGTLRA